MTAFTTISNALVAVGAKPFATTVQAFRDNLLAAFEGDATAVAAGVTLKFPALDAGFSTAGGIGSYVFARRSAVADSAFGATIAGSGLFPTSAFCSLTGTFVTAPGALNSAAALSGTWRCMGESDYQSPTAANLVGLGATLWMRIA